MRIGEVSFGATQGLDIWEDTKGMAQGGYHGQLWCEALRTTKKPNLSAFGFREGKDTVWRLVAEKRLTTENWEGKMGAF